MKFAYSQQPIRYGSLAANGAGVVREAMRGRSGRGRIADVRGAAGWTFYLVFGAPTLRYHLWAKATHPNLGLPFALDVSAPPNE